MNILVFIGALIGFLIGKLPGLIIGAGLGYWGSRAAVRKLHAGFGQLQSRFIDSTFAVMGALCKADGQVSADEIRVAETLFDRLRLTGAARDRAKDAFRRGKESGFDLDAEVAAFRQACGGNRAFTQMFLQIQMSAIAADGVIHPAEHEMLLRVARGLGLSDAELEQIEAMFQAGASRGGSGRPSTQEELDSAYRALGVSKDASDAEVKRAYRKLMSENHPDKLASRGVPESMREFAEQKTREITSAYDRIKEARGQS